MNRKIMATLFLVGSLTVAGISAKMLFVSADGKEITVGYEKDSNGKKNITKSLKKAISEANSNTKIIIPEGEYVITEGIEVNKDNVTIKGKGNVILDGQARIKEVDGYKKPSATKVVTSSNYKARYVASNTNLYKGFADDGDGSKYDVFRINASNVTLDNVEITGVYKDQVSETPVAIRVCPGADNAKISNCKIHDFGSCYKLFSKEYNAHGIIVSGNKINEKDTINNVTIKNCDLYNLFLGQSEALVLNGNVEGFEIANNYVHDCDNIGIDLIGYENSKNNKYDRARGYNYETKKKIPALVYGNTVINISSGENTAYRADEDSDGKESRCAGGIYVDGGLYIDIYDNYVENSDIGIELASEHKSVDTENINVYNNTLIKNDALAGFSIGGSEEKNGGTKGCAFSKNTVYNTDAQCLNFQLHCYSGNEIKNNIIIANGKAQGCNIDDENTAFKNDAKDNISNVSLDGMPSSSYKKTSISVVSYDNELGKEKIVIDTKEKIKNSDGAIYGSDITVKKGEEIKEPETVKEEESKEPETVKKEESKEPETEKKEKETKESETEKKEKETKKPETVKEEESKESETVKETEIIEEESKVEENIEENVLLPEVSITSKTTFYSLKDKTNGKRIKFTKKKNKENWNHVDINFLNLDLSKYSKVKISIIPSRKKMNLGITNMDEDDPIFYRNHWESEGKFTSTEEQVITINLNEDNKNGLYLYFDATTKDGSSSEQKCYITAIEFE